MFNQGQMPGITWLNGGQVPKVGEKSCRLLYILNFILYCTIKHDYNSNRVIIQVYVVNCSFLALPGGGVYLQILLILTSYFSTNSLPWYLIKLEVQLRYLENYTFLFFTLSI